MIYVIMMLFSVSMLIVAEKFKEKKIVRIISFILSGLSMFIVSAIRFDVGTDYLKRYAHDYIAVRDGKKITNLEYGFKLLIQLCTKITDDYVAIFVVTSFIIVFITLFVIYKHSKRPVLSLLLYFLTGFYFHSLNLTREYVAISIIFLSYKSLIDKRYILFILALVVSFFIHSSCIVAIIALFLCNREVFDLKRTIIFSIIFFIFGQYVWHFAIEYIIPHTRFGSYVGSSFDVSYLRSSDIIINVLIYIVMYFLYKNCKEVGREEKFFLNMQACSLFFMILSSAMYLMFRLSYYFGIFCIIGLPNLLSKADLNFDGNNKIKIPNFVKNIGVERFMKTLSVFIVLGTLSVYIVKYYYISTADEILPYKTIFEIEDRRSKDKEIYRGKYN